MTSAIRHPARLTCASTHWNPQRKSLTMTKIRYQLLYVALICMLCFAVVSQQPSFAQDSPDYIQFLEQNSMLFQADQQASVISGEGVQWRQHYGDPEPAQFVQKASVWLLYYPGSAITKPNQSVLGLWGDTQFWDAMQEVGI